MTAMNVLKVMTLSDVVKVFQDLDGYIAKGGELLELPLFGELSDAQRSYLAHSIDPDTWRRWSECVTKVGELTERRGSGDGMVGDCVTEDDARRIWRETK